jgi:hypothetical protein
MSKDELRKRIDRDAQLKSDFDFLIARTDLRPSQLLTGLWFDCNLMKAHQQALLSREAKERWPLSEDTLRQHLKNIRRAARQIETTNKTEFSPARTHKMAGKFSGLPETLRDYARELERKLNLWAAYWKRTKSRIPHVVSSTRENSLYELVRSSAGGYHLVRMLRLVNTTREVQGLPKIQLRAFTMWINRFEKRRKEIQDKRPC